MMRENVKKGVNRKQNIKFVLRNWCCNEWKWKFFQKTNILNCSIKFNKTKTKRTFLQNTVPYFTNLTPAFSNFKSLYLLMMS